MGFEGRRVCLPREKEILAALPATLWARSGPFYLARRAIPLDQRLHGPPQRGLRGLLCLTASGRSLPEAGVWCANSTTWLRDT